MRINSFKSNKVLTALGLLVLLGGGGGKTLKVYRNGELDSSFGNVELQHKDKYLVSFGSEDDVSTQNQIKQVPDYEF